MRRREVKRWAGLSAEALRERWGRDAVHLFGKIDSSSAAARDLAEAGAPDGTVVVCREQTAGRGREGRTWHSPSEKGVYLSLVLRPPSAPVPPLVSVAAGLGVVHRMDRAFPALEPALKWPNDLMADDRKLGGILGEAGGGERGGPYLILGVGVNVKPMELPDGVAGGATWVQAFEEDADLPSVGDAVLEGLESQLRPPPAALDARRLELLDRYDWLRDRRVRVRVGEGATGSVGVCVGIAPDGALLFRPDGGALRRLASATVEPEEGA